MNGDPFVGRAEFYTQIFDTTWRSIKNMKPLTTRTIFLGLVIMVTSYLVYLVILEPAHRLEIYWLKMIKPSNAKITVLSSRMVPWTRAGLCRFKASSADVEKIVNSLSLKPVSINLTFEGDEEGCRKWFIEFLSLQQNNNPILDKKTSLTLFTPYPIPKPGAKPYKIPLTAEETYFLHFRRLYYSSEYQVGCVDMLFPYG